jgi:hypothetical protein
MGAAYLTKALRAGYFDPTSKCTKVRWLSRADASRTLKKHAKSPAHLVASKASGCMQVYKCPMCRCWHVGNGNDRGHSWRQTTPPPIPTLTEADLDAMPVEGIKRMGVHIFVARDGAYAINAADRGITTRIAHEFVTDRAIALFEAAIRLRKSGVEPTKQNVRDEAGL